MELETSYLMDPDLLPDQVDLHTDPDQQSSLSALDGIADDDVNQNKNTRKKGAGGNKVTSEVQFYELSVSPTIFEYKACVHQRSGLTTYQIKLIYVLLLVSVSIMICLALSSLQLSWTTIICLAASPLFIHVVFILPNIITEESVVLIHNFGIQVKRKYYFKNEHIMFIEKDKIEAIFIHEYIYGTKIKFSLAMIVTGQDKLCLLFKHVYPGYHALQVVYAACMQELT